MPCFALRLIMLFMPLPCALAAQESFNISNFDAGWQFHRSPMIGAEQTAFDDSHWRTINLPHDWSIEDIPGTGSPFDSNAVGQVNGGFTAQGTSWYRKSFIVPASSKNKIISLRFDGVYMNADVYLNGTHIATHPYGYTPFTVDVSSSLILDSANVIAIEVKNEGATSRWYSGSGIYRHVWLQTANKTYFPDGGVFITSQVAPGNREATIKLTYSLNNGDSAAYEYFLSITDPGGNRLPEIRGRSNRENRASVGQIITQPRLWSPDTPNLYTATLEIARAGEILCREVVPFGIRSISFDERNGFLLNGKQTKLKGGCFHNDNGPLGAKAIDRAEERKVEIIKANGFNAVRCSHNPPSIAFLDACDRLGILVIDEFSDVWNLVKNPYDYHLYFRDWWKKDLSSMLLRDRNHPSIIMWSIGNELPEKADSLGFATAHELKSFVRSIDSTRPVTAAVNDLRPDKDPFFAELDISGYNYAVGGDHNQPDIYASDHARIPDRIMFCTESYPLVAFGSWKAVEDHPYVIGDFVWTAWDYIGEASIGWLGYPQSSGFFPWNLAYCGDIDMCGWKRPQSFYRDALWMQNKLSLFVTPPKPSFPLNAHMASWSKWNWFDVVAEWNWPGSENKPLEVTAYSSCERVELFLNNRSLGSRPTTRATEYKATWRVPYQPGQLMAIGYRGRKKVQTSSLSTPRKPAVIKLTADRTQLHADGADLSYVTAEVLDDSGNIDYTSEHEIEFSVLGNGSLAGVGNANPVSLESFQQPRRKTWKGRCLLIVQAGKEPGKISIRASADSLTSATLSLESLAE